MRREMQRSPPGIGSGRHFGPTIEKKARKFHMSSRRRMMQNGMSTVSLKRKIRPTFEKEARDFYMSTMCRNV